MFIKKLKESRKESKKHWKCKWAKGIKSAEGNLALSKGALTCSFYYAYWQVELNNPITTNSGLPSDLKLFSDKHYFLESS